MNENGNSLFLSMLLLMLISLVGIIGLKNRLQEYKDIKNKTELLLCTKTLNGEVLTFHNHIKRINKYIKTIMIAKLGSYFIPGFNITTKAAAKIAIRVLKAKQYMHLVSFQAKSTALLLKRQCLFSPKVLTTPYHIGLNGFKRNKLEEAIIKGAKWQFTTYKEGFNIKNKLNTGENRIFSKMKTGKSFWNYL